MRWRVKQGEYRVWFAWHPVYWNGEYIWLENIQRCRMGINHGFVYKVLPR